MAEAGIDLEWESLRRLLNDLRGGFFMKEFWNVIQLVFTAIGGWLGWFLGGCDGLIYALIAFVTLDYITGLMCAVVDHKLSSAVFFARS